MAKRGHHFKLVNIGREHFCGDVQVETFKALLNAVSKHLRSRDVTITVSGQVFAGVHPVGKVEPQDDVADAALRRWVMSEED
jgi:hypothetical protein